MYDMVQSGKLNLPDDDTERNMYWYVKDTLELEGYTHYEISNFAKANRESKHNVDCWNQKEYIGFGLSAHSYIKKQRFSNTTNLEQYICNIELNQFEKNRIIEEVQNEQDMEKEFMLLGLRKIEGVSIQNFKNKFGENPIYIFMDKLKKLVDENLLDIDGDNIKLTNRGLDLANLVWEEFV
jgi:oxygen-independent coproporphyrinogen-3 oxidase